MKQWYLNNIELDILRNLPWRVMYYLVDYRYFPGMDRMNCSVKVIQDLGNGLIIGEGSAMSHDDFGALLGVYKDDDGEVIIPFNNISIEFNSTEGIFYCKNVNDERIRRFDTKGRIIVNDGDRLVHISCEYDDAHDAYSEGLLAVHRFFGKQETLTKKQLERLKSEYPFLYNVTMEEKEKNEEDGEWEGGWGYINNEGKEVIACKKDIHSLGDFHDGLAWVKGHSNGYPIFGPFPGFSKSLGYINKSGKLVLKLSYDNLGDFKNGIARIKSIGYIDKKGRLLTNLFVGLGEVLWDEFPTGKRLGGAPANFAFHASQFGHMGLVLSAIGLDKDGQDIISELESHSLPYFLDKVSYKTGTVNVDMTDPNAPVYTIRRPVAWDHIPFTDELKAIARNTRAVCYGTLAQRGLESRRTIRLFLDSCPSNCLKICDINLRQSFFNKAIIQESLRRADILKLNEEELGVVTGLLGYGLAGEETLCRRLMRAYKLRMVILTKGVHGSWVLWKGGKSYQGTPKVRVVSAVGAGDAFTGAFIGSYLNGASIEEAHEVAVRVSAYVCTKKGAMPEIPESAR